MDPSSRIGTTLRGKWRIDRLLGTGGFASVYAATHRAGKRVAIKVLHPALSASAEVRRRFLKEAYAANAIEHPGVVGVSDDDVTEDGAAFLVMDLLEGDTVDARRKKAGGKMGLGEVLSVAEQALDALAAAHEKGIVHRDLKPENLFWTTTGQLRVLDFGIARFREPGDESTSTQTGMTMGSPAFMAPEQARGRWAEVDARTDVYAMGATMFTLLSGTLVHGKLNLNEALIAAATMPPPPLGQVAPDVPQVVAAVVDRALAFDKNERWADARTMQQAVRSAKESLTGDGNATLPLTAAPALTMQGAVAALSVLNQTTPLGTGPAAPAMRAPVTEIAAAAALPDFAPGAGAPQTTPAGVVTTHAPRRKIGAGIVAGGALTLLVVAGGIALGLSGRTPAGAESGVTIAIPEASGKSTSERPEVTAAPASPAASEAGSNGTLGAPSGAPPLASSGGMMAPSSSSNPPTLPGSSSSSAGPVKSNSTSAPTKPPAPTPPPGAATTAPPAAKQPAPKSDPLTDRPRNK